MRNRFAPACLFGLSTHACGQKAREENEELKTKLDDDYKDILGSLIRRTKDSDLAEKEQEDAKEKEV